MVYQSGAQGADIGFRIARSYQAGSGRYADDLGGGVFKKRLKDNRHRSIVLANAGRFWVFAYLFAKKDRANIDDAELVAFKALAGLYRKKTASDIETELRAGARGGR